MIADSDQSLHADDLEEARQFIVERVAGLLEHQLRADLFAANISELVRSVNGELSSSLSRSIELIDRSALPTDEKKSIENRLESAAKRFDRLESTLALLIAERQRQQSKNKQYLKQITLELNEIIERFKGSLVEKDLLERQSQILEAIVLSHEKVSQWKLFVQEILSGYHGIFPFNFFFIAFVEDNTLSLCLYYMGEYGNDVKLEARTHLANRMLTKLGLPADSGINIEEFMVHTQSQEPLGNPADIDLITVPVPDLESHNLGGLLGMAFGSIHKRTAQEESVIRSTLAVMVMVVGSSKTLSRTLSELEYYSNHDPLTGLHNRRYFNEMITYEEGRSERHHHEFSVLMLDIDDFKEVNDTYGHVCGDSTLVAVSEEIGRIMRRGDIATRIGGDEFAIILTETSKEGARIVAEKLRLRIGDMSFTNPEGKDFHITASVGLVTYPEDGLSIADLMSGVDIALYRAKSMGKNGVSTILSTFDIQAGRSQRDEAERLRSALQERRIIPYYQPVFNCQNGELFAFEALARLRDKGGETHSAAGFIETIEKYGLGRDLDRAIIETALPTLKSMSEGSQNTEPLRLFINLSAQEIQGRGILGFAEKLCDDLEIAPLSVVFEILERDAIGDMTNMRRFLSQLRDKGFSFALDDFGSGYNSFHYLRELRFEFVKLDGAFVKNILVSKIDSALVSNLSRLCQEIEIKTIAEFVESQAILDALKIMGVDYVQGFFLGMPSATMRSP